MTVEISLVTGLVILLPGMLVSWVSGLRLPWAAAAALPVTFSIYGLAGWLYAYVGIPFNVWTAVAAVAVVTALAYGWRRAVRPRYSVGPWWWPAAGVVAGSGLIITQALRWLEETPRGIENIVQGWDVHWHANVVTFIAEEGIASATRMGQLQSIESAAQMYYPVAYHAAAALVVELTGASPIAANNIMAVIAPGIALPVSLAALAYRMVGDRGLTAQLAGGLAAVTGFMIPTIMWVGHFVGAWPYFTAVAASGAVAVLFFTVPGRRGHAFAAALALAGITQLHPSAVTTVVLLVFLYWLLHLLFAPARSRGGDLLTLAGAGLAGAVLVLPQIILGSGQAEEVANWDVSGEATRTESWVRALTMDTRHVSQFYEHYDPTVILAVAAFGAVALMVWRRNFWAPAFWGFSVWLTAHALHSFDIPVTPLLDAVAGLHYATAHRLVMPVALMVFAAAGVGLATAIRLLTGGPLTVLLPGGPGRRVTPLLAVVVAVAVGAGTVFYSVSAYGDGAKAAFSASRNDDRMVSAADLRAWDWLAEQPKAYEGLIGGEPADGTGWMYAYNGLPSLYRHYLLPTVGRESATVRLYRDADLLGEGTRADASAPNVVDAAAEELEMNYVVLSPWPFWAFQFPRWSQLHGLFTADGATLVYRDGDVFIFAVTDNFTEAELARMRSESPEPVQ